MFMSVTDKIKKTMIFKIYMINNIFKFTKSPGGYLKDTVSYGFCPLYTFHASIMTKVLAEKRPS